MMMGIFGQPNLDDVESGAVKLVPDSCMVEHVKTKRSWWDRLTKGQPFCRYNVRARPNNNVLKTVDRVMGPVYIGHPETLEFIRAIVAYRKTLKGDL